MHNAFIIKKTRRLLPCCCSIFKPLFLSVLFKKIIKICPANMANPMLFVFTQRAPGSLHLLWSSVLPETEAHGVR